MKGRVVFLDFWATWCPPCVVSSPEVEKLVETYKSKPVDIISISLDSDEEPVKKFVAKNHTKSRVALAGESGIDVNYRVSGIPAFYLIDQKGNVVRIWEGYSPAMSTMWRTEIDQLLSSK